MQLDKIVMLFKFFTTWISIYIFMWCILCLFGFQNLCNILDPFWILGMMFYGHLVVLFFRLVVWNRNMTILRFILANILHSFIFILPLLGHNINPSDTHIIPMRNLIILLMCYFMFMILQSENPVNFYREAPQEFSFYKFW